MHYICALLLLVCKSIHKVYTNTYISLKVDLAQKQDSIKSDLVNECIFSTNRIFLKSLGFQFNIYSVLTRLVLDDN